MNEPYCLMSAREIDGLLEPILSTSLKTLGMQAATPRRWVGSSAPMVRTLFEMCTLKGAQLSPRWGFSLAYVPHFSGTSLRWHRTPKSTCFDVCYDPQDDPGPEPTRPNVSCLHGSRAFLAAARDVIPWAAAQAARFFARVTDEADLITVMEALRTRPTVRLAFDNYVQQPLAYALTLARSGRRSEASAEFERYLRLGYCPDRAVPRLREVFSRELGAA